MCFQALTPVEEISIIRTGCSPYLFVSLDGRVPVPSKLCTLWGTEGVSAINLFPVFGVGPASFLPRMPSSGPALELEPDQAITGGKGV